MYESDRRMDARTDGQDP